MTDTEFTSMGLGDSFQDNGKPFLFVQYSGTHAVAHPKDNPRQLIHFYPHQASRLTKLESKPDIVRPKSSHNFPLLERAKPKLPAPHTQPDAHNLVCLPVDEGVAEFRAGNAIGKPIPEAIDFLRAALEKGIPIQISTDRPQDQVYEWLRINLPGSERLIHISPHPPPRHALYVSRNAYRAADQYPTTDELTFLMHNEETTLL